MKETAIAVAIVATLLTHYVFSFQRFTLGIARRYAVNVTEVAQIQMLMTPILMGAAGWGCHVLLLAAAVLLGVAFAWWVGVAFLLVDVLIFGGFVPLFPLNKQFAGMAQRELRGHLEGPNGAFAAKLMADVDRARGGNGT